MNSFVKSDYRVDGGPELTLLKRNNQHRVGEKVHEAVSKPNFPLSFISYCPPIHAIHLKK